MPWITGCDGCRGPGSTPTDAPNESPVQDFTSLPPRPFPNDSAASQNAVKPGHWFTASVPLRSNKIDARGSLRSDVKLSGRSNLNTGFGGTEAGSTESANRTSLSSERSAVLPKSQMRRFDTRILAPRVNTQGQPLLLSSRFVTSSGNAYVDSRSQPCNVLEPHEYFAVVLTRSPERFARLKTSDWVRPFMDTNSGAPASIHYRLVFPFEEGVLPLSSTILDWTQTSVVIWDDMPADALTPAQLQALRDWIYFGGRLIVNGSDGTDALVTSSLEPLLPIKSTGNIELDVDSTTTLLKQWSVAEDDSTSHQITVMGGLSSRIAAGGSRRPDAVAVAGTDDLVTLVPVGGGMICQSRFDLTSGWLANWKSFDSFFNAAILGRPPRKFVLTDTVIRNRSVEVDASGFAMVAQMFQDDTLQDSYLPAINTSLRFLARDAVLSSKVVSQSSEDTTSQTDSYQDPTNSEDSITTQGTIESKVTTQETLGLTRIDPVSGVAGWTDESDVMSHLIGTLRSESGIEIPKSSLVIRSLGIYLFLLVPVNYLLFRFLGRLEYAWLAAPVIAILGAVWVAREAQLDIGFARSQTELALLEVPSNYSRGHLTRAIAIYNSLSTRYDILFDHPEAVAAPVGVFDRSGLESDVIFATSTGDGAQLNGIGINSNQVRLLHTEEIIDIGGLIRRDGEFVVNETSYDLVDMFVVEKLSTSRSRVASVANCAAGGRAALRFRDAEGMLVSSDMPMQTATLVRRLVNKDAIPVGAARVVARIEGAPTGMNVVPETNQRTSQTILVAHLSYGRVLLADAGDKPTPDANLIGPLLKDRPIDFNEPDVIIRDEP